MFWIKAEAQKWALQKRSIEVMDMQRLTAGGGLPFPFPVRTVRYPLKGKWLLAINSIWITRFHNIKQPGHRLRPELMLLGRMHR